MRVKLWCNHGWALRVEQLLAKHFAWRVVAVSRPVAAQFHGPNVVVVHDALAPEDGLSPDRAGEFRAGAGIADDVPLVGAAGRLDTWKGFDVLLSAFPEVRRQRSDAQLVVAGGAVRGKESYAEELEALARRTEGVHWLGSRRDMAELMADLDLFVLPSTEPEPFASAALEALASGVPLAATDHGGSPEMLQECPPGSGQLFVPKDASALAQAVLALLPAGPSSVDRRRARSARTWWATRLSSPPFSPRPWPTAAQSGNVGPVPGGRARRLSTCPWHRSSMPPLSMPRPGWV